MVAVFSKQVRGNGLFDTDQWENFSQIRNGVLTRPREIHYKVIMSMEDIKNCLHLRYYTYNYVNFIEENQDHLDIDPYDRHSTFLGAYDVTAGEKILIGTLHIISADEQSNASHHIDELIRTATDLKIRNICERPELFPIMESFKVPESYLSCFGETASQDSAIHPYELSRLAVRPDYWMHNIEVGLHHLLILDSWLHNPSRNDFLIAVHPRSRRRYERVGFRVVPGTGEVLYKHINQLAIAMILDLNKYLQRPQSYRGICESLVPFYEEHGYFSRIIERRKSKIKHFI